MDSGDCQRVGQTVREPGRMSESRADCQKVNNIVREAATSSWKRRRRLITMTTSSSGKRRHYPHTNTHTHVCMYKYTQKVRETVRESGRLSESRGGCQKVGETPGEFTQGSVSAGQFAATPSAAFCRNCRRD